MSVYAGKDIILTTGSLEVDDVRLDGAPLDYNASEGTIKISPPADGDLAIRYTGTFKDSGI